jgi:hypothetical protein
VSAGKFITALSAFFRRLMPRIDHKTRSVDEFTQILFKSSLIGHGSRTTRILREITSHSRHSYDWTFDGTLGWAFARIENRRIAEAGSTARAATEFGRRASAVSRTSGDTGAFGQTRRIGPASGRKSCREVFGLPGVLASGLCQKNATHQSGHRFDVLLPDHGRCGIGPPGRSRKKRTAVVVKNLRYARRQAFFRATLRAAGHG